MKKEFNLNEKIIPCDGDVIISEHTLIKTKDVKEKIQNAQRRLKMVFRIKEAKDKRALRQHSLGFNKGKYELEVIEELSEEIDKIFFEEFGEKLI